MTKRTRTLIFLFFVILFILAAPSAVFYSQGYRVDFEAKKIVQTGGFYFKVLPGRADIFLNGKLEKSTSMISDAAYIKNLLPKNYKIEIKKDGYHSWEKTLGVKEKEVTEAKNVVLFPENPQFFPISSRMLDEVGTIFDKTFPKIAAGATSSDEKKIVQSDNYEIWVSLLESDPPLGSRGEKIFLTRFSEKMGKIFWLNDYYLMFSVGDKIKIAEIDNRDGLNIIDLAEFSAQGGSASGGEKPEIIWDKNAKKLYVISKGKTYFLENLLP